MELLDLPAELLGLVAAFLPGDDVRRLRRTCRPWNDVLVGLAHRMAWIPVAYEGALDGLVARMPWALTHLTLKSDAFDAADAVRLHERYRQLTDVTLLSTRPWRGTLDAAQQARIRAVSRVERLTQNGVASLDYAASHGQVRDVSLWSLLRSCNCGDSLVHLAAALPQLTAVRLMFFSGTVDALEGRSFAHVRTLVIEGWAIDVVDVDVALLAAALPALETLALTDVDVDSSVVAAAFPSLRQLTVLQSLGATFDGMPWSVLVAPNLTGLDVGYSCENMDYLEVERFPRLARLGLDLACDCLGAPNCHVDYWARHVEHASLAVVRIDMDDLAVDVVPSLLERLPGLTELTVVAGETAPTLAQTLATTTVRHATCRTCVYEQFDVEGDDDCLLLGTLGPDGWTAPPVVRLTTM
jgi:hypothetical protein